MPGFGKCNAYVFTARGVSCPRRTFESCSGPMAIKSSTSGWCALSHTPPRWISAISASVVEVPISSGVAGSPRPRFRVSVVPSPPNSNECPPVFCSFSSPSSVVLPSPNADKPSSHAALPAPDAASAPIKHPVVVSATSDKPNPGVLFFCRLAPFPPSRPSPAEWSVKMYLFFLQ